MPEMDELKAEVKKLSAQAMQAKMDLHDLAEELPTNWTQILSVAQRAYDSFKLLEMKRAELKSQPVA